MWLWLLTSYPLSARGSFSWLYAKHPHATDAFPIRFPHARWIVIFSSRSMFSQDFTIWFQKMSNCCKLFVLPLVPYKAMCTPIVSERKKMSSQCTWEAYIILHSPNIPHQSPTDMGSSNWIVRLWRKSRIFECSNACWRTSAHAWWQILLRRQVVQPELQGNPRMHKTNVHIAWLHVALSYCMMIVELHLNMQWICPQWILLRHLLI